MARQSGVFPYSEDEAFNPRTDGTQIGSPISRNVEIPATQTFEQKPKFRGAIRAGGIGNTDVIDTNTTAHTVFTGSY